MLRLSCIAAVLPLLLCIACERDPLAVIDPTRRGPAPPPIVEPDDDDDMTGIAEPAEPDEPDEPGSPGPAVTLRDCAPSLLNGCNVDSDDFSVLPATLPTPRGELPEACMADTFLTDNRAACGEVYDVDVVAGATFDDAIGACPAGTLCRVHLPPSTTRFSADVRLLNCLYVVGDDDGTSVLELSGSVRLQRVGLESLTIRGIGAGANVLNHALFLDVDIIAEDSGISIMDGDVKVCASTVRAGYNGLSFGSFDAAAGLLISHSVIAGCYSGVEAEGEDIEIADSIVQGAYEALDARGSDVILRRSEFVSVTIDVDTIDVGAGSCSDEVCGVDYGSCGDRAIDYELLPLEQAYEDRPPVDVPTEVRCEPRQVVELAGLIDLAEVRAGGVETHPGATANGQSFAWCVDTLRFVDALDEQWIFETGEQSSPYTSAFPESCDTPLCGALHFADGVVVDNACTLYIQCDADYAAAPFVSMFPGRAVREDR